MDLLINLLPVPRLESEHEKALSALPERMRKLGYSEAAVLESLRVPDVFLRYYPHLIAYRRSLAARGTLGLCIRFFLLQELLSISEVVEILGEQAVCALRRLNWLEELAHGVRSRVDFYPCLGRYIFTDTRFSRVTWQQQVYALGGDSYGLARLTPRNRVGATLDICTGSGVHAVLAAAHSKQSMGLDINARALQFSQINALVNGVETHCKFSRSDCYAAVAGQKFDLITLNPPFVPTPEGLIELFRTGGETGEGVTRKVVSGLPEHLNPGGVFSMFTEAPVLPESFPLDRLVRWLPAANGGSAPAGWGVAALHSTAFSPEAYIGLHLAALPLGQLEPEFERWLATYERVGISAMWSGHYFAVRLRHGGHWRHERWISAPSYDYSGMLQHWLEALDCWSQDVPEDFIPRLHPLVERVFYSSGHGALVDYLDPCWAAQRQFLPDRLADVVHLVQTQSLSVGELAHQLDCTREELDSRLAELGEELVVTSWLDPQPKLETLLTF